MTMREILFFNALEDRWPFAQSKEGDSGFDLRANVGVERTIDPGRRWTVPVGVHLAMPVGVEAQTRGRSGLARDHGIVIVPGTIDSGYRGEIAVTLINLGDVSYKFVAGDRIAQLVFAPVYVPEVLRPSSTRLPGLLPPSNFRRVETLAELPPSARGTSGFGSTGR